MVQTAEETKYTEKFSILLTKDDLDNMKKIAKGRGDESPQGVFREAVSDYIRKNLNPNWQIEQLKEQITNHPEIVRPLISEEVKLQLPAELRRILGTQ